MVPSDDSVWRTRYLNELYMLYDELGTAAVIKKRKIDVAGTLL
jgi:hypothetical protein